MTISKLIFTIYKKSNLATSLTMSHCKISDDENLLSGSCKENKYMQMRIEMKLIKMNILHLYSY